MGIRRSAAEYGSAISDQQLTVDGAIYGGHTGVLRDLNLILVVVAFVLRILVGAG